MAIRYSVLAVIVCLTTPASVPGARARTSAGRRVALVIGNADYADYGRLAHPAADARAIAKTLDGLGFEIIRDHDSLAWIDASRENIERGLGALQERAKGADAALVYYAGHGFQLNGRN